MSTTGRLFFITISPSINTTREETLSNSIVAAMISMISLSLFLFSSMTVINEYCINWEKIIIGTRIINKSLKVGGKIIKVEDLVGSWASLGHWIYKYLTWHLNWIIIIIITWKIRSVVSEVNHDNTSIKRIVSDSGAASIYHLNSALFFFFFSRSKSLRQIVMQRWLSLIHCCSEIYISSLFSFLFFSFLGR